ncbi:hypothetical protein NBH00_25120 [Paraconexibacter antarcticus]|uniref:DUF11 domain-containing protein n=1 Tax=Paraconexibacter antarcticus TaxID=2949664 RepID=A0ABY5DSD7_9ACTN|nr:choice-of-anchor P family protein [Paraconexibacter antarcticus]UTI64601.1 hypothetical protein NBH00_25120 [Paraconexibacter antarcticus]
MRRLGLAGLLALLFATAWLVVGAPVAGATNVVFGGFEIDGNLADNSGPGDPIDWATPPPNLTNFTDGSGNKDDGFATGSKELDPAHWACTTASAPGKDDILGGQIAFRRGPATTGHQYAYVDYTRKAVTGDAHVDYEFNKSGTAVNSSCGGLPKRTAGDVLISFDTNNGGATIDVVAYTWDGSTFVADAHAADNAVGAVNIPNTIPGHTAGDFGEAAIDLTNAIGEISCGEFSGVYMKTRSSTGINSALQDFTKRQPLNIGECPASSVAKTQRDATTDTTGSAFTANPITASPGDFIEYQLTYRNNGPGIAHAVILSDTLNGAYTLSTCDGCTAAGQALTWSLGDVGPGGTITKTVRAQLTGTFASGATTTVTNAASAASKEDSASSNTVTLTVSTPRSGLKKEVRNVTTGGTFASTAVASPGDTLEYRLTYSNSGPGAVSGASVTDTIDARTTFVPNPPTCTGCSVSGSTLTWAVGSLGGTTNPGSPTTKSVTFQVRLASTGFGAGTSTDVKNTADGTSTGEPGTTSTATTTVRTPSSSTVKKVRNVTAGATTFATTATAKPGDVLEYQLVYTNAGPGTATGETVTDTLAAMQTFVAGSCTASTGTTCAFGAPVLTWTIGSVPAGGTRTLTFQVKLDNSFPAGSTPVLNAAVYRSDQEPPVTTPPTTVTVTANPSSSTVKAVRNVTTNGTFASTATAKPGNVLEYRLSYTNTGDAPATNAVVTDTIAAKQTYVPSSCTTTSGSCTVSSPTVTWTIGTVAPGDTKTLTFQVTLTGPFSGASTTVKNVATADTAEETPKDSNETSVTVVGTPKLTLVKAADRTAVGAGDSITYTLTYGNSGDSTASASVIDEVVPAGTSFVSCSDSCTVSSGTVSWNVGSVSPGGGGSVTMTVQVDPAIDACAVCNVATMTSPDQTAGPTSSNRVCATAQPSSDPSTANAAGSALGLRAYVPLLGIPLVNQDISHASSTRTGVGASADEDQFLHLDILGVVGLTSVAKADVLNTSSSSQVTKALGAQQTSTSEVLGLDVLSGVVTADTVRSVASTTASGTASSYSAAGTTLANLKVLGSSVVNPAPGLKIPLDNNLVNRTLYGEGSYVAIDEQTGSTSSPASGQLSGGTYKADLTVTAIRVYITGGTIGGLLTAGGPPVEITVAKSVAHAEHRQTRLCTTNPNNAVSGHAFVGSAQVDPLVPAATVGFVDIPASGGSAHMDVPAWLLPADGSIVTTSDAASDTTGTNGTSASTSSSYAQAAGVCLLKVAAPGCLVKATLVRSQSNSTASSGARSSNGTGTQFVDLVVAGIPISGTPPPNTTITLPLGLGYVVLNEQTPDAPETGHTGLTVRAIHIKLTTPLAPLLTGAEVIVAEAHSDALWR